MERYHEKSAQISIKYSGGYRQSTKNISWIYLNISQISVDNGHRVKSLKNCWNQPCFDRCQQPDIKDIDRISRPFELVSKVLTAPIFQTSVALERNEIRQKAEIKLIDLLKILGFYFWLFWRLSLRFKVAEVWKKWKRSILLRLLVYWISFVTPCRALSNLHSSLTSGSTSSIFSTKRLRQRKLKPYKLRVGLNNYIRKGKKCDHDLNFEYVRF